MDMYWVYDLPNWLFGTLTIAVNQLVERCLPNEKFIRR